MKKIIFALLLSFSSLYLSSFGYAENPRMVSKAQAARVKVVSKSSSHELKQKELAQIVPEKIQEEKDTTQQISLINKFMAYVLFGIKKIILSLF